MFALAKEMIKQNKARVYSFVPSYDNMSAEIAVSMNVSETFRPRDNGFKKVYAFFRKVLLRPGSDVIIQHGLTYPSCILALLSTILRKKFVFMFASDVEVEGKFQANKKRCYLFPLLLRYSFLVSQNAWQYNYLKCQYKKDSFIYYNGLDFSSKKKKAKKSYILWVSRADVMKQPHLVINLAKDMPKTKFIMICPNIGYDNEYAELHAGAATLKNLTILEFVPFNAIQKYFDEAHLLINTSTYEGFPQTFVQAAYGETPIVSLNVDPDGFISGNACGVVCGNDYGVMKESINRLITDNHLYKTMRNNIKQYAATKHDIARNVACLIDYINCEDK